MVDTAGPRLWGWRTNWSWCSSYNKRTHLFPKTIWRGVNLPHPLFLTPPISSDVCRQRLLFRVLHCISLKFPKQRYVQGMAPIAATLLCYYPDDIAFVMLVRLWQDKGLKNFFLQEFDGLMTAFKSLDETLAHRPVGKQLVRGPQKLHASLSCFSVLYILRLVNRIVSARNWSTKLCDKMVFNAI